MIYPSTESNKNLPIIYNAYKSHCWDKNGEKYIDFIGGNNTIVLGHLSYFFTMPPRFSGESFLEKKISKRLSYYTKTNYFRYFKNGSDAVSCALRLARNILKLDNSATTLFIGYGGSNNEFVSTISRNSGVPFSLCTQKIEPINYDIVVYESRYREKAMSVNSKIRICDHLKSGILGLDEKTDDIDLYGKSIANGYPISIMTAKNNIMERINEVYYSTTFGGDNLGLEAIDITLNKFNSKVKKEYLSLLKYAHNTLPKWQRIDDVYIKKFLEKKILFNGNWQIMTCHTKKEIDALKKAINLICPEMFY